MDIKVGNKYTFTTQCTEFTHLNGCSVKVVEAITEPCEEFDGEVLPMYTIKFSNDYVLTAYPEELNTL